MTIIIWGIGERTRVYLENGFFSECTIKGYIDKEKGGTFFQGKTVWLPADLIEQMEDIDFLVICNRFFSEVYADCLAMGIDREKIVFTDWVDEPFVKFDINVVQALEPKLIRDLNLNRYKLIEMNEKDIFDKNCWMGQGKYVHPIYTSDYFRYRSFEYMAELLEEDGVQGALAEFGVFRGDFSSLINQKFPDRKLYLFDTFEGFEQAEIEKETVLGRCDEMFVQFHAETSIERMMINLPFPEQCIICKGFFPQSITEKAIRETYAFVSIDVDFEDSIYEGLSFFYPRLNDGGVIFLHDYNSAFLGGVKLAVKRYEEMLGHKLKKVPFADRAGTLVIMK